MSFYFPKHVYQGSNPNRLCKQLGILGPVINCHKPPVFSCHEHKSAAEIGLHHCQLGDQRFSHLIRKNNFHFILKQQCLQIIANFMKILKMYLKVKYCEVIKESNLHVANGTKIRSM
jgi:hypothetical protein